MNYNKCPKCGYEIVSGLKYCPNCGNKIMTPKKKISTKKSLIIIISSVMVLFIISILGTPNNNLQQTNAVNEDISNSEQIDQSETSDIRTDNNSDELTTDEDKTVETATSNLDYDLEISMFELTNYYYEYGHKQGNVTYFGKRVKTSAIFNYADSSWPKIIYFSTPDGGHYSASCGSFEEDSFDKMSSKNKGDSINFIGKVDELISTKNYK